MSKNESESFTDVIRMLLLAASGDFGIGGSCCCEQHQMLVIEDDVIGVGSFLGFVERNGNCYVAIVIHKGFAALLRLKGYSKFCHGTINLK